MQPDCSQPAVVLPHPGEHLECHHQRFWPTFADRLLLRQPRVFLPARADGAPTPVGPQEKSLPSPPAQSSRHHFCCPSVRNRLLGLDLYQCAKEMNRVDQGHHLQIGEKHHQIFQPKGIWCLKEISMAGWIAWYA